MQLTEIRWLEIGFILAGLYALWYLYKAYRYAIDTHEVARKKTFNGLTELMRIEADQDERNCRYRVQKQVAIILLVISALFRPPVSFDMGIEGYSRAAAIFIFAYLQYKYIIGSRKDEADRKTKLAIAERKWQEDEKLRKRVQDVKAKADEMESDLREELAVADNDLEVAEVELKVTHKELASSESARKVAVDASITDRGVVVAAQLERNKEAKAQAQTQKGLHDD